jgi:hypothetical protein
LIAGARADFRRKLPRVFPEQLSRGAIQRLDLVAVVMDEQDAISNQRRGLRRSRGQGPGPGDLKSFDIGLIDLIERAISPAVRSAATSANRRRLDAGDCRP